LSGATFVDGPSPQSWRRPPMPSRADHRHLSRWSLTLAATLALAPGCSKDPEPEDELVPFRTSRGLLSYHYVPRKLPAAEAPTAASAPPLEVWLRQQRELAAAEDRRRLVVLADQDLRRQREERWRREQQELAAYQAARQQIVQERRQQQQALSRAYDHQRSQWFAHQRERAAAEVARWQQASRTI